VRWENFNKNLVKTHCPKEYEKVKKQGIYVVIFPAEDIKYRKHFYDQVASCIVPVRARTFHEPGITVIMIAVKYIGEILGCIMKKQVVFCYTSQLKERSVSTLRVKMEIYIGVDQPGNYPYQEEANKQTRVKPRLFKKSGTANQPAGNKQVKEEE
jgi:hypothetical protein